LCRALKLLCAAPDRDCLGALKRATVAAHWELVGGATSLQELVKQADEWRPDIVVVDGGMGVGAVTGVRARLPSVRIVSVGPLAGADEVARSLDGVREAILGLPPIGGPVHQ